MFNFARYMINIAALVQLKAFARQDGVFVALLWTASFLAVVLAPTSSWGSLLAMGTPFLVGYLLMRFRNGVLDGVISFRRAWALSLYIFFYASLLFAVIQYVYLRFFDNGSLNMLLANGTKVLEPAYRAQGMTTQELTNIKDLMLQLSPVEKAFIFMMQNLIAGFIMSLPIALVCRRSK